MAEKVTIWCEQHEESVGPDNYDMHRNCLLSRWEYGWHNHEASDPRPKVPGNLGPEGGHMQSPIKLVPGVAADGQRQFMVRMVEPEDGEVYIHAKDIVTFLRLSESAATRTCAGVARDITDALDEVGR